MKGSGGRQILEGTLDVTLDAAGAIDGAAPSIVFPIAFDQIPNVLVTPPFGATMTDGDEQNYRPAGNAATKTGFTLELKASEAITTFQSQTFTLQWIAVEPL